jgi:aminoglycoside phosphotransferase (APT) family kinase protein
MDAGEVICHLDLYWTNVIFRDGLPVALIDWELAAPGSRLLDNLRWLEEQRDELARFLA